MDLEATRNHAVAADLLLLSAPAPNAESPDHAWLSPNNAVVHQAVGVLGYRHAISMGDALALLRAHALVRDTDLSSLAYAVVHEHLELPDPQAPPGPGPAGGCRRASAVTPSAKLRRPEVPTMT